jgi:hypothetical protein
MAEKSSRHLAEYAKGRILKCPKLTEFNWIKSESQFLNFAKKFAVVLLKNQQINSFIRLIKSVNIR